MNEMTLKFTKNHGPYPKDTVATFPASAAHNLINKQVAVEYVAPVEAKVDDKHPRKKITDRPTVTKTVITK